MNGMGKNTVVRIAALVCMASLLVGCNLVRVNPEKDRQLVIATVNGEDILKSDFLDQYEQSKYYYNLTDEMENDPQYKEYIDEIKQSILDSLVTTKIVEQKAREAGYTVTEEDLVKAREETIAEWAEYLKSVDESQDAELLTQEEYEQKAVESLQQVADERYTTVEDVIRIQALAEQSQAFMDETLADETAGVAEVETYYQENLASQQADISTISSADVVLYETEGVNTRYIRLKLDAEQQVEYDSLAADNEGAAASFLEDNLYDRAVELKNEAMEFDWEAMQETYKDDVQIFMSTTSFDMRRGGAWEDTVIDPLTALNPGDISDPMQHEGAYFVFRVDEQLHETVYTLEEKQEEIQTFLDQQKKDEKWTEFTGQWKEESTIKTYKGRMK